LRNRQGGKKQFIINQAEESPAVTGQINRVLAMGNQADADEKVAPNRNGTGRRGGAGRAAQTFEQSYGAVNGRRGAAGLV